VAGIATVVDYGGSLTQSINESIITLPTKGRKERFLHHYHNVDQASAAVRRSQETLLARCRVEQTNCTSQPIEIHTC